MIRDALPAHATRQYNSIALDDARLRMIGLATARAPRVGKCYVVKGMGASLKPAFDCGGPERCAGM